MKKLVLLAAILAIPLLTPACDGSVGDSCDEEGVVNGECEEGAVCGKLKGGELRCLKQCQTQADCASNEECNGVSGNNLKGCRAHL